MEPIRKEQNETEVRRNFHNTPRQDISVWNLGYEWNEGWLNCTFDIIWQAYERLFTYYKNKTIDVKTNSEDEITAALLRFTKIVRGFSPGRFEALDFVNQPPDKSRPRIRKGNTNDIGVFFGEEIEKPEFIFESKKIETVTEKGIKSYVDDLDAYLTEYYGSHLWQSGLIAYLLNGTTQKMFNAIRTSLNTKLKQFSGLTSRPHKTSSHKKTNSNAAVPNFICHHLIFDMQCRS